MAQPSEGRGHWNAHGRRSGGYRRVQMTAAAGILIGVACDRCGREQVAVAPGIEPRCLACGHRATPADGKD